MAFFKNDKKFGGPRNGGRRFGGGDTGRPSFRDRDSAPRQMHEAVCSQCGKECRVPFAPMNGKPVYCSDCFEQRGDSEDRFSRSDRADRSERFDRPRSFEKRPFSTAPATIQPRQEYNNKKIDMINDKLDRVLKMLSEAHSASSFPTSEVAAPTPVVEKKKRAKKVEVVAEIAETDASAE